MKTRHSYLSGLTAKTLLATLLAALLLAGVQLNLHAQLVADGVTVYYSSPIDISPSDLIVGTNGGKTVLHIVPLGAVTNANGTIGLNATSTNNQVHVENSGVVWQNNGNLNVGAAGSGNQLVVSNGGLVVNIGDGYVGVSGGATNNLAMVTGTGSLWKNGGDLYIGNRGSGNQLVVSNGAVLTSTDSSLGYSTDADNNLVTVTGPNSQWRNTGDLIVGFDDNTNNQVVIRDGGLVMSSFGGIGSFSPSANRHSVLVTDAGSLWTNSGDLNIGETGSGNQLVVTNGGMVQAARVYVGSYESSTNNRALVDGGNLIVTNFDGTGTLDIRRGTNVFNAGLIQADRLWLTNSAGFFDFNGGTFIAGGGTVNNGQDFVVGASGTTAAILDVQSNAPLTLNNDFILGANNAANNQLLLYDGGVLSSSGHAFIGLTASDNLVVVDGTGSSWTSSGNLQLGNNSAGNRLTVSRGGVVANASSIIGNTSIANNNVALVRDVGSLWNNSGGVYVGSSGSGNQLVVSNGAVVASVFGSVGVGTTASNNLAAISGPGSLWTNSSDLVVGSLGKGNQLVVSDGGTVQAANAYVGTLGTTTGNRVTVEDGNLIITNSGGTGTLFVLKGTNVLNAGLIQTDNLQVNNGALSQFEFNGGTLITGGGTVNNGQAFVVGASGTTPGILDVRSGTPVTLNNGFTLGANTAAAGNQLLLTNGGTLSVTGESFVGLNATSSNNLAVVSGAGSQWINNSDIYVGWYGAGNQLVVTNGGLVVAAGALWIGDDVGVTNNQLTVLAGGKVRSTTGLLGGYAAGSDDNRAVVSGPGSLWTNSADLYVGELGSGNQLMVSDGGVVASAYGEVGYQPSSSNNMAMVIGAGSLWTNSDEVDVGYFGAGNQLIISNGGTVQAARVYVGVYAMSTNNRVTVDGGNLIVTNAGGTGAFGILHGTNVLNAGLVVADKLLLTNSAGFFEFNGGTLTTRGATVNNGSPLVVGNGSSAATYRLAGNGLHTFNNGLTISGFGALTGNGTVAGLLTVQNGGTVMPGNSIGNLVLTNSPVLQGSVLMEISKTGATLTNDQIQVTASLNYGGSLVVSNLGPDALTAGNSFPLFSATSYGGAFTGMSLPLLNSGLMWTNQLLLNGSIAVVPQVQPSISGLVKSGTNLVFDVSGGSPGGAYTLLTSTNVALPLSIWTTNGTGNFDWMGNITLTNGINFDDLQRYFTISVP